MGWAGVNDIWITCSLVQIRISPIYQERYLSQANEGKEQVFHSSFFFFSLHPWKLTPGSWKWSFQKKESHFAEFNFQGSM